MVILILIIQHWLKMKGVKTEEEAVEEDSKLEREEVAEEKNLQEKDLNRLRKS